MYPSVPQALRIAVQPRFHGVGFVPLIPSHLCKSRRCRRGIMSVFLAGQGRRLQGRRLQLSSLRFVSDLSSSSFTSSLVSRLSSRQPPLPERQTKGERKRKQSKCKCLHSIHPCRQCVHASEVYPSTYPSIHLSTLLISKKKPLSPSTNHPP
ncbi:hypothetical protein BKA80DRAFT_273387 [Phyllosticta citrichinensis]